MLNNNHKNTDCGFAEQLVSYLYGEADARETAAFEAHLYSCQSCADELESFSGVHFSINDWKAAEFDSLATPVIEIPYEKTEKRDEPSIVTSSWLSGLRGLFSLASPAWSLTAACAIVLAVGLGLILFATKSPQMDEVSQTNIQTQKTATPDAEKKVEPTNTPPDIIVNPVKEPKSPKPEVVVETTNKRTAKTTSSQRQPQTKENAPKNNDVKGNKNNNKVPPGVIEEESEDDTLRLAEIFDEIDTEE